MLLTGTLLITLSPKTAAPPRPTAMKRSPVAPPTVTLRRFCAPGSKVGVQVPCPVEGTLVDVTTAPASPTATKRTAVGGAFGIKATARRVVPGGRPVVWEFHTVKSGLTSSVALVPVTKKAPLSVAMLVRSSVVFELACTQGAARLVLVKICPPFPTAT